VESVASDVVAEAVDRREKDITVRPKEMLLGFVAGLCGEDAGDDAAADSTLGLL